MRLNLFLVTCFFTTLSFGQNAGIILNAKLKQELDKRNVFIKNPKNAKQVEANEKLMALASRNFSLNSLLLQRSVVYQNPLSSSLSSLGRQIFRNSLPNSIDGYTNSNMLYGLSNGKLLSIVDPDPGQSYFKIYYGLNNILNGSGKIEASAEALNYIKGQVNAAVDYQTDRNCQFTAMIGTFKNFLVEALNRFKQGTIAENDIDLFMNLYDLYSNNTLGIADRNYIVGSIDALAISIDDNSNWGNKIDINANTSGGLQVPWARVSAMSDYKWAKEVRSDVNNKSFEIYLLSVPTSYGLPSWQQLKAAWTSVAEKSTDKYYVEKGEENINFNGNEKQIVTLYFGPFSDPNKIDMITIDEERFKRDQKQELISKTPIIVNRELIQDKNIVKLKIAFEPNTDWINKQTSYNVSNSINLAIQCKPTNAAFVLQKTFPINFNATVMARPNNIPTIDAPEIIRSNTFVWNFNLYFDNLPQYITSTNLFDGQLLFEDKGISQLFSSSGSIPEVKVTYDHALPNTLKASIKMIIPLDKLKDSDTFFKITLPLLIRYNDQPNNSFPLALTRQIPITLSGITPQPKKDSALQSILNPIINN